MSAVVRQIGSNAVANIINGVAVGAFQVAMTALVAHFGGGKAIPVWSLAASGAGFASLLSCNVATVVARRLADKSKVEQNIYVHEATVIDAARQLSSRLTVAGFLIATLLIVAVPFVYPALVGQAPLTSATLVGCYFAASCWVVYSQPEQGWLIAARRNWSIATVNVLTRVASLLTFTIAMTVFGAPLWVSVMVCGLALWSGAWLMRRHAPSGHQLGSRDEWLAESGRIKSITRSMGVWVLTSAITQAATIPVVAFIAPDLTASMYLALTLVLAFVGLIGAAANALIAPLGAILSSSTQERATRMTIWATAILWGMYTLGAVVVYLMLGPIIALWVGNKAPVSSVQHLCFALLALQHGLRNTGLASSLLLAVGAKPRTLLVSPLTEAGVVAFVAIPLAFWVGPFAFIIGLSAAGVAGVLAVVTCAVREVLGKAGRPLYAATVILLLASIAVWAALATR